MHPISITAISSISALGTSIETIWDNYNNNTHYLSQELFNGKQEWVARLPLDAKAEIEQLRNSDAKYKKLDDTVLFALYASRKAVEIANWKASDNFGINIGSSRGATALFEAYHSDYIRDKKVGTLASPTTTLGNIASWVAHDLNSKGPEISHSITCSTALHSLLNGIAWLQSGMANKFLVGGSEAPLTSFTLAQMKALKIYSKRDSTYPCQALNIQKKENTMVLGEGASVACLEKGISKNALALVAGIGYATEVLQHNISISTDAQCFQDSMKMALGDTKPEAVDVIVMHAPGTIKGDSSEYKAIQKVFGTKIPALTSNKWKLGHTFGASGMLSVELAILMLQKQKFVAVPYVSALSKPKTIKMVLVNAVGFGGNAVSVLLKLPN